MSEHEMLKLRILCSLNYHGNREEFMRGDYYLTPSDLSFWNDGHRYELFWLAVYELRDDGMLHIRYEANANMLATTEKGFNAVNKIRIIVMGEGE